MSAKAGFTSTIVPSGLERYSPTGTRSNRAWYWASRSSSASSVRIRAVISCRREVAVVVRAALPSSTRRSKVPTLPASSPAMWLKAKASRSTSSPVRTCTRRVKSPPAMDAAASASLTIGSDRLRLTKKAASTTSSPAPAARAPAVSAMRITGRLTSPCSISAMRAHLIPAGGAASGSARVSGVHELNTRTPR